MPTVGDALAYCKGSLDTINQQLIGHQFASSRRTDLVLAYAAVVLEHQASIITLVQSKLRGSAFALLRPQIETAFRSLWVNLLATDAQVEVIREGGKEPFPQFREMVGQLEEKYQSMGWFTSFVDEWRGLSGFTHTGLEQLARRFREDGNLAPNYPDEMVSGLLMTSGTVSIALIVTLFSHFDAHDKALALEEWLRRNGLK